MKRHTIFHPTALAVLALAGLALPAQADEGQQRRPAASPALDEIGDPAQSVFSTQAISETALQNVAGREDMHQISQAELAAGVRNNSVGDYAVTGNAQIDGNAFQNMSGLSILNVNTGNNVAINAAMNVNVAITAGP
ncbi:hypothetical protein [Aurantiacibacter suaedae]|uniref:hypothetical protein n=1 Tax=Aurantiacibacter suaedae TaxID=2545755 RepID=UPI0010F83EC8|nr:hypothetical protein [Aurantiacibacter suaedae]